MKKFIISVLFVLSMGLSTVYFSEYAVSGSTNVNNLIGVGVKPEQAQAIDSAFGSAVKDTLLPYSTTPSNNPAIGSSTKPFKGLFSSADLTLTAEGADVKYPAAVVVTPQTSYPTPAAGSTLTRRYSVMAAGAPTAAYVNLPPVSSYVGEKITLFNQGSNPVAIVPQGADVVNVSAAATPFSCTTLKECTCTGINSAGYGCSQQ